MLVLCHVLLDHHRESLNDIEGVDVGSSPLSAVVVGEPCATGGLLFHREGPQNLRMVSDLMFGGDHEVDVSEMTRNRALNKDLAPAAYVSQVYLGMHGDLV